LRNTHTLTHSLTLSLSLSLSLRLNRDEFFPAARFVSIVPPTLKEFLPTVRMGWIRLKSIDRWNRQFLSK